MGPAALPRCRGSIPSLYCSRRSLKPTTPMGQYPLVPSHSGPLAVWGWRPVPDYAGTVPPPRRRASWHGPSEASARSFAAPASAHEGEEEVPARTQVAVADALLRTQPEQMDLAADRINDALEAEDDEGVDLGRVKQAKDTLDAGDKTKTELLLEQALGPCPGQPVVNPTGVRAKLPQTPCPTPAHELALGRVPLHGTARPVLLTVGAVLAVGGLVMAWRIR